MSESVRPARAEAEKAPATGEGAASQRRAGWPDAPLRSKLLLLVVAAAAGGGVVGVLESQLGHRGWPLLAGLAVVVGLVNTLGRQGIAEPAERLLERARRAWRARRVLRESHLTVRRKDEVGQLAGLMHELSVEAYRQSNDANQLRRTLDYRVNEATRRATAQLQHLAMRDALTQLGNRRFLDEHLEPLVKSCRDSATDLLCVIIDMDNFKQINDTLGHSRGDELLQTLAQLIRGDVRHGDYAVRLGGDEFVILMPGGNRLRAQRFSKRLNDLFIQHVRTVMPDGVKPGLSAGVASLLQDRATGGPDLLEKADANLYVAKGEGKGRAKGTEPV